MQSSMPSVLLLAFLCGGLQLHLAAARRISSRGGQTMSMSAVSASSSSSSSSSSSTAQKTHAQKTHTQTRIQRRKRKASSKHGVEEEPVQKCIYAEDLVLQCPEAGQRVGVVTAFWNRRKRTGCQGEDHNFNAGLHCKPNATDKVIEMCQGQAGASCTLPQGYTGCEENPFTFMRVRWHCISKSGDIDTSSTSEDTTTPTTTRLVSEGEEEEEEEEFEEEWEEGMQRDEGDHEGLPTISRRMSADESDPDVQKWEETPASRLGVSSLRKEHCNSLEVGAWPKVGETGCELTAKAPHFGGSSPHFEGDSVCACHFFTPLGVPDLATDCDTIFPNPTAVYKTKAKEGHIAIFGKEGCDCQPSPLEDSYTICDLAVREV